MSRVKVTINKKGYIPSLGQGPIRRPILIAEELYRQLVALGYPVKVIAPHIKQVIKKEEALPVVPPNVEIPDPEVTETSAEIKVDEQPAVEDEIVTEDKVDDSVEETEEEVVITETEEVIEILQNDPDLSPDAYYTEDFLTSKALCKKILSSREIQYDKEASFALLKQLVFDSNPEVDIVSE